MKKRISEIPPFLTLTQKQQTVSSHIIGLQINGLVLFLIICMLSTNKMIPTSIAQSALTAALATVEDDDYCSLFADDKDRGNSSGGLSPFDVARSDLLLPVTSSSIYNSWQEQLQEKSMALSISTAAVYTSQEDSTGQVVEPTPIGPIRCCKVVDKVQVQDTMIDQGCGDILVDTFLQQVLPPSGESKVIVSAFPELCNKSDDSSNVLPLSSDDFLDPIIKSRSNFNSTGGRFVTPVRSVSITSLSSRSDSYIEPCVSSSLDIMMKEDLRIFKSSEEEDDDDKFNKDLEGYMNCIEVESSQAKPDLTSSTSRSSSTIMDPDHYDDYHKISSSSASSSSAAGTTSSTKTAASRDPWYDKYQELCKFHQEYGHCLVPSNKDNQSLSQWVKRQRHQRKIRSIPGRHSTLTMDREDALNRLNFVWDSHGQTWNERYSELLEFKAVNGHCNVPTDYPENPQLSIWVKGQRRQYKLHRLGKKSNTSPTRISKLDEINFVWNPRNLKI